MSPSSPPVERRVVVSDAESLIEQLLPSNPIMQPRPREWIFRGVPNAGYELLPSAFRRDVQLAFEPNSLKGPKSTREEQVNAEFNALMHFYDATDSHGFAIPGDGHHLRTPEGWSRQMWPNLERCRRGAERWPCNELLGIAGLAQHYGIPTRLLDWSLNSLVAAYFAACEAADWVRDPTLNTNNATKVAVWCLNMKFIFDAWPASSNSCDVLIVSVPRASNPNLHAQGGVFTLNDPAGRQATQVVPDPLDTVIEAAANLRKDEWFQNRGICLPVMRELVLDIQHTPRLLRYLADHGVSAATIYPGLKGVSESLNERRRWDVIP